MLTGGVGWFIFMLCRECEAGASRHDGGEGGEDDGAETGSLSRGGQQQEMRATRRSETGWSDGRRGI